MTKIAGSGSRYISQRLGSADPDTPQNVMDPEHCRTALVACSLLKDRYRTKNRRIETTKQFAISSTVLIQTETPTEQDNQSFNAVTYMH
jgi:hypothetical protein